MSESGYLTTTVSTCAVCGRLLLARVHGSADGVHFHKHCPEHGQQSARVYPDIEEYLRLSAFRRAGEMSQRFATDGKAGCPESCGLCPEHEQHVCLPIIEITDHCDMACPICLVHTPGTFHRSRAQVATMLDALIATEGQIDVLNLSGGEPTIHPDFRSIVEECVGRKEILYVSVSTNGRRLATDESLLRFLAERRVIISLQFDGLDPQAYTTLRGANLRDEKLRLIDTAGRVGARMSLTSTIARGVNDQQPARILPLLFERENILSVMFQPATYCGRGAAMPRPDNPVTVPDVIRGLDGACGGMVSAGDFSPLPCSHPACFALAFYLKIDGGRFVPIKSLVAADRYLDMIQNRALLGVHADGFATIKDAVYDLWSGPAGLVPDSQRAMSAVRQLLASIDCSGSCSGARATLAADRIIKSVFIHHFMDRHTFDLSRARKCCQVYPQPDGRLIPACVYNCLKRP